MTDTPCGLTVSAAVCDAPLNVPVIVASTVAATALVSILKIAEDTPMPNVSSECAGVAADELLDMVRVVGVATGPESVAVPVTIVPPMTCAGFNVIDRSVAGRTVIVPETAPPIVDDEALTVTLSCALTGFVVAAKFAVVLPAAIETVAGT